MCGLRGAAATPTVLEKATPGYIKSISKPQPPLRYLARQGKNKLCIINFENTIPNTMPGEVKPSYVYVVLQLEPTKWVHSNQL